MVQFAIKEWLAICLSSFTLQSSLCEFRSEKSGLVNSFMIIAQLIKMIDYSRDLLDALKTDK